MKILVVDDEKLLVKGIKFNLENDGYEVSAAYDGEEAVELARNGNFDLQVISSSLGTVQPNCFNQIGPSQMGKSVGHCRITDPLMEELVERASSSDPETQKQGFSDIIDYVFNNYCLVGLCTQNKYCAVTTGLKGLTTGTRMSYIDVSYMYK